MLYSTPIIIRNSSLKKCFIFLYYYYRQLKLQFLQKAFFKFTTLIVTELPIQVCIFLIDKLT